jgi:hypothetical protein
MTHMQAVRSGAAERYLLDEMSEVERHAFEEHYFACMECAEDVRAGALMRDGVKTGMLEGRAAGVVKFEPRRHSRASIVLPWAVAATLAVAIGYQSLTPNRGSLAGLEALAPVTLRPASRGAEATVSLRPGARAVTLAPDVMVDGPAELAYELRTTSNKIVASGRMAAPAPGTPLLMLVPAWTLTPAEHYILDVRHAATNDLLGTFRFGVTE